MKTAIANTAGHIHDHMAKLTMAILGACIFAALFYVANLYMLISHTVAMQKIESRSVLENSALSKLDSEYLKLVSAITPDSLAAHGLIAGQVSLYITRPAPTASLENLATLSHEL